MTHKNDSAFCLLLIGLDAFGDEIGFDGIAATFTKGLVVVNPTAFVGMTFDLERR